MPRGDGTGPMGMGAMTGRGAGFCSSKATAGYVDHVGRFGGIGCRRGFRRAFYTNGMPMGMRFFNGQSGRAVISNEEESDLLKREVKLLENQLEQVNIRLSSLKKNSEE